MSDLQCRINLAHAYKLEEHDGNDGALPIDVPRDWDGSFEPKLIKKGQIWIDGMDSKIINCPAGDCTTLCREGSVCRRIIEPQYPCPP